MIYEIRERERERERRKRVKINGFQFRRFGGILRACKNRIAIAISDVINYIHDGRNDGADVLVTRGRGLSL